MLRSKLPHIGTTIFTQMSALANETGAINLSQGFPNFPLDERLTSIFADSIKKNVHQYAPMEGLPALRELLCSIVQKSYQRHIEIENVLITAGATQAIFTIIQALVHENDTVIVIDPAYDCYRPALDLVKANTLSIPLTNSFQLNLERIKEAMQKGVRMLIINNPHNPTGTVFEKAQLDELAQLLSNYPDCIILSDEVYEWIYYTDHSPSLQNYPELHSRLICVSSFGKSLHITGWKVGYIVADSRWMHEIKKVHQFLVFSVSHFAQSAIHSYLLESKLNELGTFYLAKRNQLAHYIEQSKFTLLPCRGTYFQTVDISEVTGKADVEYALWLTKEIGVATIPLSVFYAADAPTNYLRLCFAKDDNTLIQAGERLCQI